MPAQRFLLWATLLLPQMAGPSAPVTIGHEVEGALAPGDQRSEAGALADTFLLESTVAQTVTVLVHSLEADTRVSVLDESGQVLGTDDQGGIGDDPRLAAVLAAGGTYRIRVEGGSAADAGSYRLELRPGEVAAPGKKAKSELDLAYYTEALAKARARGSEGRRRAGWVLARRGDIHRSLGLASVEERLAAAEEALSIAAEVGDRKLEAKALEQCGSGYVQSGRPRDALPPLERSRALYQELRDVAGEVAPTSTLGTAYVALNDATRGIALQEEALGLCERSGERRCAAVVLNRLGGAYMRKGDSARALAYGERALQAAREGGDEKMEATLLGNLSRLHGRAYNYARAIDYAERALRIARALGDRFGEAVLLETLAEMYHLVGLSDKAVRYGEDSVALHRAVGDPGQLALALSVLGSLHSDLGRHASALRHLEEARALQERTGANRHQATTLRLMGDAFASTGQWERARRANEEAVRVARKDGDLGEEGEALQELAAAHLHLGDAGQAMAMAEQSVEVVLKGGFAKGTVEWGARTILAQAASALGLKDRARQELDAAVEAVESVRLDAGEDLNRAGYLDKSAPVFETYVAFLVDERQPEAALAMAERARARALLDVLGTRKGRPGPANESAASTSRAAGPPSLEGIREAARRRQATLVEYFIGEDRLFIWVVTPEGEVHGAVSSVKRSALIDLVRQMRSALTMDAAARDWEAPDEDQEPGADRGPSPRPGGSPIRPQDGRRALRRLHDLLVAPVQKWLPRDPDRLVTIVPHGPLFLVSFAALLDAQGRYLIERHTLSYTPSIGVLAYMEGRPPPLTAADTARVLVVGNPAMPSLPGRARKPAPLPGAEAETRLISRLYGAARVTTLIGPQAEERRVRELAPAYGIIHLATHGFIRDDDPQESLLALSPSPPDKEAEAETDTDGLLTVREIAEMELQADLVVLSACNTGLGRVSGDGVIGLTRAFLQAGSPRVLASLWQVADVVASPHMERFYRALREENAGSAGALRAAQLATIRGLRARHYRTPSGSLIPDLPTFWAAFVLIGDPS